MSAPMIRGDHIFTGQTEFSGMIGGNATISSGAKVIFKGMVNGNLIVMAGGEVHMLGMINGKIIDQGGTIHYSE